MVHSKPANPGGKALVEPQLYQISIQRLINGNKKTHFAPPVHRDQVTEPLMRKLVSDDVRDPVLVLLI